MASARPLTPAAVAVVVVLSFSWALQQIAIKVALIDAGAFAQGGIRAGIAAVLVGTFMLWRKRGWVPHLTIVGITAGVFFAAEFVLVYKSLEYTGAARATMFVYTAPFVVAVGSHFRFAGEQLDLKGWAGIGIAFAGVVIALKPAVANTDTGWLGDAMALAAGFLWGLTTLIVKGTRLRECPASQVLLYQLGVCALIFAAGAFFTGDTLSLPLRGSTVISLIFQSVWVAAISYGIWFAMIAKYSATAISVITFLTPLFGVALGVLALGESPDIELLLGAAAVAAGILLVNLPRSGSLT